MKVKVKTVKQEVFEVELQPGMKVSDVKAAIETQVDAEKFQRDLLTIVCKGKCWSDNDASLEDMGIGEGGVIVVVVKKSPAKPAPADAPTPTPAPETKPAEAAPAAAPSEPAAATATEGGEAPPAGGASAFVTGSDLQSSVKAIMEMGFSEADVKRAMRAAFNNPERAVEYLMTGIPAGLEPPTAPAAGDAPAAPAAPAGAVPAAPAAPAAAAGAPAAPNPAAPGPNAAPLDMWGAGGAAAAAGGAAAAAGAGGAGGMANVLEALQSNPQMQQRLQQLVQNDPNTMLSLVQELARNNPQLLSALQSNPQAAIGALLGGGAEPQGEQVQLDLSEADEAAITHLEALGFARVACIQAYIACEKNEELAANYLLENGTEEDMQ